MIPTRLQCLLYISMFLSMSVFISGDTIAENIGGGWLCVLSCAAIFLLTYTFYRLHLLAGGGWGTVDACDQLFHRRSLFLDCSFPLLGGVAEQIH